jgi:hypothetical protein
MTPWDIKGNPSELTSVEPEDMNPGSGFYFLPAI